MYRKSLHFAALLIVMLFLAVPGARGQQVKNIIFMVGDGMGVGQMTATMLRNYYIPMNFDRAQAVGLIKTYSANNMVTDSGAAATAFACGVKTNNSSIGVDPEGNPHRSIVEKARSRDMATGFVVTSTVTDATPAGFYAHVRSRHQSEDIALQLVESGIDVWMGGGGKYFTTRTDGRNLVDTLRMLGYVVTDDFDRVLAAEGRLAAIMDPGYMPSWKDGREGYLPAATAKALELLSELGKDKGFFVMIEGSQIDGGGHSNNIDKIFNETQDFDDAVGIAMDFADRNPGTLVLVVADHETGGLTILPNDSDFNKTGSGITYRFVTGGHSGVMVPLLAYGAGAAGFSRILDNTEVNRLMCEILGLD